jgi:hypothetical protein
MSERKVIIRKGEALIRHWNKETHAHEETRKADQTISDVLQMPVEIEDTTFGRFFEFIIREKDLYEHIFTADMYGHPLAPYIEEIGKPVQDADALEYVEISWYTERFEGKIELASSFDGFGRWPKNRPDGTPEKGGIGIEYTPLNEYKLLPLKLDTAVEIHDLGDFDKPPFTGTLEFTVYDVIRAILFEITWSGDITKGRKGCPACVSS